MKNIILILILLLSFKNTYAILLNKDSSNFLGTKNCKIITIKKQKNIYIIHARCDSIDYRIVSVKEKSDIGKIIKVGEYYKFSLYSYYFELDNHYAFMNFEVTKDNFVLADRKTRELCYSINLKGLYYSESFSLIVYDSNIYENFKIIKIQTADNYFRITVRDEHKDFIVISKQIDTCDCHKIKKGDYYRLELVSYFRQTPWQERFPLMILIVDDLEVENDISTRDLFYTKNLKGLCYIK
jgi:hypothetical protein